MKILPLILAAFVLGLLALTGAEPPATVPAPLAATADHLPLARTDLFFGRVSPVQWDEFLAQVVTPRFPDGLTWADTHGQWQNPTGIVTHEDSCVLVLIHAPTPEKDRLVEEVRAEFKTRFHQQSVMRVDQAVTASF